MRKLNVNENTLKIGAYVTSLMVFCISISKLSGYHEFREVDSTRCTYWNCLPIMP